MTEQKAASILFKHIPEAISGFHSPKGNDILQRTIGQDRNGGPTSTALLFLKNAVCPCIIHHLSVYLQMEDICCVSNSAPNNATLTGNLQAIRQRNIERNNEQFLKYACFLWFLFVGVWTF